MSTPENRKNPNIVSFANRIKLRFTRHEAWTLKTARKAPLFALFAFATLWVWLILPLIPIGIASVALHQKAGMFGTLVNIVLGMGILAIIAPWFFRWYLICAGLMLGHQKMVQSKEDDIQSQLERLIGSKPPSNSV